MPPQGLLDFAGVGPEYAEMAPGACGGGPEDGLRIAMPQDSCPEVVFFHPPGRISVYRRSSRSSPDQTTSKYEFAGWRSQWL